MKKEKNLSSDMVHDLAVEILHLHKDKAVNHNANDLILVCDKEGHCDSYYQADEIFFWEGKDEKDYITLTNNSEGSFWNDDDVPTLQEMITETDDLDDYKIEILEHINS